MQNKFLQLLCVVISVLLLPNLAQSANPSSDNAKKMSSPQPKSHYELAVRVAPVKSHETLASYMVMTPSKDSPLKFLSPTARRTFLESLTFNEKGLTGFNYAVLRDELSEKQIERVLALFGSQHSTKLVRGTPGQVTPMIVIVDDTCDAADCMDGGSNGGGIGWNGGAGSGGLTLPGPKPYPNGDLLNMWCAGSRNCAPKVDWVCKNAC